MPICLWGSCCAPHPKPTPIKALFTIGSLTFISCGFGCRLTGGALCSAIKSVRSATQSYDEKLAAELWDESAEFADLPKAPKV